MIERFRLWHDVFCILAGTHYGFGTMTIERHKFLKGRLCQVWPTARLRVFFAGKDVTDDTVFADDTEGDIELYLRKTRTGERVVLFGMPVKSWKTGPIEWRVLFS